MRSFLGRRFAILLAVAVCAVCGCGRPVPTPTPVRATLATVTPTPTVTLTASPAPTPTPVPTATVAPLPTATATAAPAAESGGLIALSARIGNNWDIYAVDALTGERTRLTADPAEDRHPAFSPDGLSLAFASRRDGHWNLYLRALDGAVSPLTGGLAYDGAPAWSPDGARIAFESQRGGDLDVWAMDLESREPVNLTPDSPAVDCGPAWSPDGTEVAFTSYRHGDADIFALDVASGELRQLTSSPDEEHLAAWLPDGTLLYTVYAGEDQDVYRRAPDLPSDAEGERLTRWRFAGAPAASPDGTTLAFLLRRTQGAQLLAERPGARGEVAMRLSGELFAAGPLSWTAAAQPWRAAQGAPLVLYEEETRPGNGTPYDLQPLEGVDVGNPWLSDRVDDSFWAMKQRVTDETGHDFFAQLSDAWRAVSYYNPGSSYTSWHKAGRAIDTLLDYYSADGKRLLEVALDPGGGETYWRLYLRCAAQDGSQGMPLRARPWAMTAEARRNGQGGYRKAIPAGYYVDLTDLIAQYGWLRIASHDHPDFHWYTSLVALEYWHFQKTDGLLWWDAMLELFPPEVIEMHHSWEAQQLKGTPAWLAWAKGIPLPPEERRTLEMIAP